MRKDDDAVKKFPYLGSWLVNSCNDSLPLLPKICERLYELIGPLGMKARWLTDQQTKTD